MDRNVQRNGLNIYKKMKKDRESNIELLRILLLLIICFWHVIVHGYKFAFMKEAGIPLNAE